MKAGKKRPNPKDLFKQAVEQELRAKKAPPWLPSPVSGNPCGPTKGMPHEKELRDGAFLAFALIQSLWRDPGADEDMVEGWAWLPQLDRLFIEEVLGVSLLILSSFSMRDQSEKLLKDLRGALRSLTHICHRVSTGD